MNFIIISGYSVTLMPISASVENLHATQLCEGKAVQWPQHHGDNITNSYTHEKVICRTVHFSCLMHNSYDQKISDQSDDIRNGINASKKANGRLMVSVMFQSS